MVKSLSKSRALLCDVGFKNIRDYIASNLDHYSVKIKDTMLSGLFHLSRGGGTLAYITM